MHKAFISKEMTEEKLAGLNLEKEGFELVIGIGSRGKAPAKIIAAFLNLECRFIEINFRNEHNKPCRETPVLLKNLDFNCALKKILLVDDFCNSGKTFELAKKALAKASSVKALAVNCRNKKADFCLFDFQNCVDFSWNSP